MADQNAPVIDTRVAATALAPNAGAPADPNPVATAATIARAGFAPTESELVAAALAATFAGCVEALAFLPAGPAGAEAAAFLRRRSPLGAPPLDAPAAIAAALALAAAAAPAARATAATTDALAPLIAAWQRQALPPALAFLAARPLATVGSRAAHEPHDVGFKNNALETRRAFALRDAPDELGAALCGLRAPAGAIEAWAVRAVLADLLSLAAANEMSRGGRQVPVAEGRRAVGIPAIFAPPHERGEEDRSHDRGQERGRQPPAKYGRNSR